VAETGNESASAVVNAADAALVSQSVGGFMNPVGITSAYDFNRDHFINAFDVAAARDGATIPATVLQLISPGNSLIALPFIGGGNALSTPPAGASAATVAASPTAANSLGAQPADASSVSIVNDSGSSPSSPAIVGPAGAAPAPSGQTVVPGWYYERLVMNRELESADWKAINSDADSRWVRLGLGSERILRPGSNTSAAGVAIGSSHWISNLANQSFSWRPIKAGTFSNITQVFLVAWPAGSPDSTMCDPIAALEYPGAGEAAAMSGGINLPGARTPGGQGLEVQAS